MRVGDGVKVPQSATVARIAVITFGGEVPVLGGYEDGDDCSQALRPML